MTVLSISLKQCSSKEYCVHPDCESGWLPATHAFFTSRKTSKNGLGSRCLVCERDRSDRKRAQPGYREKEAVLYLASDAHRQRAEWLKTPEGRAWRKEYDAKPENKAKKDSYNDEWRERPGKKEASRERARQRHIRLKDDPKEQQYILEYHKEYSIRPEVRERDRLRRQTPKYKEQQQKRRQTPEYRAYMKIYVNRRLARKASLPDTFNVKQWNAALEYFDHSCAVCGRSFVDKDDSYTAAADHWIPLSSPLCPGTIATNIIPLCHGVGGCNNSKKNNLPEVWLTRIYDEIRARIILARIEAYFRSIT